MKVKEKDGFYNLYDINNGKNHTINKALVACVTGRDEGEGDIAFTILFSGGGTLDVVLDRQAWKAFSRYVLGRDIDD